MVSLDSNGVEISEPASVQVREKLLMYPPGITAEMLPVKLRMNERRYRELQILGFGKRVSLWAPGVALG